MTKLCYILLGLFCSLYTKGFCMPEEEGETKTKYEDDLEGIGLGEGEGKKDISDQVCLAALQ